ncbi:MAG: NADH dehydrogenase [uncultured Thermomicrobiales bacterium]|uniref:NADH:ubiquinone reductase (non-electrogenic) n=1 Tax=uncultured Thermomicrobiales bacterium TaxID=1645740 RepID=A0A6J4VG08_9BACT|nr:MAG: NADH dehydrogenase [uncultured Thermomicrobiales bacterium]
MVIVGAGFGGLETARALADAPVRVTVVDRRNHHLFQPLLYQVATAALSEADIASPIRGLLRGQKNASVLLAEATEIDPDRKQLILGGSSGNGVAPDRLAYDYLVLATGSSHTYFGHDEWAPVAPGLKTIEDATEIRRRVFRAFELAERTDDPAERDALLSFVVVGAGPTGVELAGSLAEIARATLPKEFTRIRPQEAKVYLLEGLDKVLPPFPEDLGKAAKRHLEKLGVIVRLGAMVTHVDEGGVTLGEERIPARTVIWAAGVKASPLARSLGVEMDRAGRVLVEPDLRVPGRPEVFVVGDLASVKQSDGKPVPGIAPAAMQGGRQTGANLARLAAGEPTKPFAYQDRGNMAIVARNAAVADIRGRHVTGFPAWLLWLGVHLYFLRGIRNRASVLMHWVSSYATSSRGARLITKGPNE